LLYHHYAIFMVYCLKLVVIGVVTLPATTAAILFGLFDPHGKHVYGISRLWTWIILTVGGVTVKINGLNNIDARRQYVFMVNHQSNLDIPLLIHSLRAFQLRWIAKKELLWVPLFGWAMWASKHITVNRTDRLDARDSLVRAKKRIESGICVVVFPEGTRSSDGKLLPFKRGGFWLAAKTRTPIVPVTINGSGAILPKGDWRIRRGKVEVTVGEPLVIENYRPGTLRALSVQLRELMEKNLSGASAAPNERTGQGQLIMAAESPAKGSLR
jgi:1-acyl-sn-glycerol-3-phosphate acyltransferase